MALTRENTAILMIDHAVGFGTLFRSHDTALHVRNSVAVAKTAKGYGIPLVVTNGADTDPAGPLFPELEAELGDTDVIVRNGNFNVFDTPEVAAAVEATGRRKLLISGLMTEGCVLLSALSAVERGYEVHVIVDAVAGETPETHQMAVQRMVQTGIVPVTWLSLATEYQVTYANLDTVGTYMGLLDRHSPALGLFVQHGNAQKAASSADAATAA